MHDHFQELVSQLIDAEIDGSESEALFAHLSQCLECREFLNVAMKLRTGLVSSRVNTPDSVSRRFRERVIAPRQSRKSTVLPQWWTRRIPMHFSVLVFLILLVATGAFFSFADNTPFHRSQTVYLTRLSELVVVDDAGATSSNK